MALLDILNPEQRRVLGNVRAAAERVWRAPLHRYYTDHTTAHSERVIALLDGLTAGMMATDKRLAPGEAFVLLAAAYLHDVGMQDERFAGGDLEAIRAAHHEVTAEWIYRTLEAPGAAIDLGLPDDPGLVEAVALTARAHRKVDLTAAAYDPFPHGGEAVRPRLLGALLRFGDELDIDHRRVDLELMKVMNPPVESQFHWWKCHYVSGVSIVDETIRIVYRLPEGRPEYEGLIVPLVEADIRACLAELEDIFRAHAVKVALARSQVRWMRALGEMSEEVCKFASMQVCRSADSHTCKLADLQTCIPANLTLFDQRGQQVGQQVIVAGNYVDRRSEYRYTIYIEHVEGLAIGDGARVGGPGDSRPAAAPPGVSVSLLTRIVPTAFCYQLAADDFPLVSVALDNTGQGCANAALRVTAIIEGCSDVAVASFDIAPGKLVRLSLLPLFQPAAVATLNDIRPATLRVTVEQTAPAARMLYDQTERIHLHARDTALLAAESPDGSIFDLTRYLAAWVTPRRPEIERLLRRAADYHPDRQFVGYQGATTLAQAAGVVRQQAKAIFSALKQDAGLVYINSPLNLGKQAGQVTQRVRLPSESLAAGGSANCIDGTVLFASLLELASIQPLLVLVPGHAFVGWRIWPGVERYEFLETTLIGSADFDAAQQAAQDQYDDVLARGYFSRGLYDPGGFARLIDVDACRARGIVPLE